MCVQVKFRETEYRCPDARVVVLKSYEICLLFTGKDMNCSSFRVCSFVMAHLPAPYLLEPNCVKIPDSIINIHTEIVQGEI